MNRDLAGGHGGHEDDSGVNASAERRQVSFFSGKRSGQPSEKRHVPNWIDRGPKGSEIFADFN